MCVIVLPFRSSKFKSLFLHGRLQRRGVKLKIISYVKTSGKTGSHIFVPVISTYSYGQTRAFAEIVGRIITKRIPQK
jgi:bifunctional non-homologous end joining protein LigD